MKNFQNLFAGASLEIAVGPAKTKLQFDATKAADRAQSSAQSERAEGASQAEIGVGVLEEMKGKFAELVAQFCGSSSRIVIFIDDLDRLNPARAVELLEVIKNIIDVPRCVFVLAIDYAVVQQGLEMRKGTARRHDGRDFFEKIIQVPFRMPIDPEKSCDFLLQGFLRSLPNKKDDGKIKALFQEHGEGLIRCSVGHNPRALKRVLNLHAMHQFLRTDVQPAPDSCPWAVREFILLALTCMQVAHPHAYSVLLSAKPAMSLIALAEILSDFDVDGNAAVPAEATNSADSDDETTDYTNRAKTALGYDQTTINKYRDEIDTAAKKLLHVVKSEAQHSLDGYHDFLVEQKLTDIASLAEVLLTALDYKEPRDVLDAAEVEILEGALRISSTTTVGDSERLPLEPVQENLKGYDEVVAFIAKNRQRELKMADITKDVDYPAWVILKVLRQLEREKKLTFSGRNKGRKYIIH